MTAIATPPVSLVLAAVSLVGVHLLVGRLRIRSVPRSIWLSGAGGTSVAYVFVHILPELNHRQQDFAVESIAFLEHHVYLLALVGFSLFYGLERFVKQSGSQPGKDGRESDSSSGVFSIHVGSFAAYNAIVGYLLVSRGGEPEELAFFVVAMALHFVVNDHSLREHHDESYDGVGRWILASGLLAGVGVGWTTALSEVAVSTLFALLAGGIILNVIKEELPRQRESNFWAFGGGSMGYAAMLLII